eukprot:COSAG06_NODE_3684_length_5015_cov_4.312246_5_plen_35_part_00
MSAAQIIKNGQEAKRVRSQGCRAETQRFLVADDD